MTLGPDTRQFSERMRDAYRDEPVVPRREFLTLLNILDNQGEPCLDHNGIGKPGMTQCPACWDELQAYRRARYAKELV